MKVRFLSNMVGTTEEPACFAGDEREVDAATGRDLIASGSAVEIGGDGRPVKRETLESADAQAGETATRKRKPKESAEE